MAPNSSSTSLSHTLIFKGALSRAELQKFNRPKTCLHHWKPINSGQVFLKLPYQCTEVNIE